MASSVPAHGRPGRGGRPPDGGVATPTRDPQGADLGSTAGRRQGSPRCRGSPARSAKDARHVSSPALPTACSPSAPRHRPRRSPTPSLPIRGRGPRRCWSSGTARGLPMPIGPCSGSVCRSGPAGTRAPRLTLRSRSRSSESPSFAKIELVCFSIAPLGQHQLCGDRGVRLALRHLPEHLQLARGQRVQPRRAGLVRRHQPLDHGRVDHRPARGDPADRVGQLVAVGDPLLDQVAPPRAAVGQQRRARRWPRRTGSAARRRCSGCLAAIARPSSVWFGGMRMSVTTTSGPCSSIEREAAREVRGRADEPQVGRGVDQAGEPVPQQRVVLGENDRDRHPDSVRILLDVTSGSLPFLHGDRSVVRVLLERRAAAPARRPARRAPRRARDRRRRHARRLRRGHAARAGAGRAARGLRRGVRLVVGRDQRGGVPHRRGRGLRGVLLRGPVHPRVHRHAAAPLRPSRW